MTGYQFLIFEVCLTCLSKFTFLKGFDREKKISYTLIGETFASPKIREFFWINFRDLTNRRNFAR